MDDLAIIVVSHLGARWVRPCLATVYDHLGACTADVVVVSNADDETEEIVAREFPRARTIHCENRGFAHANNVALATCEARYVLFLNLDTEILDGTFEELLAALDGRPGVGLAGVKQRSAEGELIPTVRRFQTTLRTLGEALGAERLPRCPAWLRERELDLALYDHELPCDWVSGSFLIVRREVLAQIGGMDERFFLYSEESDLCLRAKNAGWEVHHLPTMTILHHAGKAGFDARLEAQNAYARLQFAEKHSSPAGRRTYRAALSLGYALRAVLPGFGGATRRQAARAALRVVVGLDPPPFARTAQAGDLQESAMPVVQA